MRDNQRQRVYDAEIFAFLTNQDKHQSENAHDRSGSASLEGQRLIDPYPDDLSLERVQDLVDKVFQSKYVKRKWKHEHKFIPLVRKTRANADRGYADYITGEIALPEKSYHRRQSYILHECAHFITDQHYRSNVAGHGWEFCDIYLDLVRHFMGKRAHEALKRGFLAKNVKFSKTGKRTITPEHRAKKDYRAIQVGGYRNTQRFEALVDEADAEDVNAYRWGMLNGYVYRTARVDGKRRQVYMHRELLGLVPGDPGVDHINGDALDNRRENLRICTNAQNNQNRHNRPYRGATWHTASKRWQASAKLNKKQHYLGLFDTRKEAAAVAAAFRREHMPFSSDARTGC